MTFEFCRTVARDAELGLEVRRSPRFWDDDHLHLDLVSVPDNQAWPIVPRMESAEREYEYEGKLLTNVFPIAFRLSRSKILPVAKALGVLKGNNLTVEDWMEEIRKGVFAYQAQGGGYLKLVPDFEVTVED